MATTKTIDMERFAFDVFVYTLKKFNFNTVIPESKCSPNTYEHLDFFHVFSREYIVYQLKKRDTWKPVFEVAFKSNGLKKFKQISELLETMLDEMDSKPERNPMDRIVTALAVINELIQFLYSKYRKLFLNDLARFWKNYFAGFEKEFEEAGGFSSLYSIHKEPFQDKVLEFFIGGLCATYGKLRISPTFSLAIENPSEFEELKKFVNKGSLKNISRSQKKLSIALMPLGRSSEDETETSASLENTGLGIPQHEELLKEYFYSAGEGTSAETANSPTTAKASALAHTDENSRRKQSEQRSREKMKEGKQLSMQITSPDGQSKNENGLTKTRLSPAGQVKYLNILTGSPVSPEGQSKLRNNSTGSPVSTEGQSKLRNNSTGSPVSLEGQSKLRNNLTKSPLSPEGQSKLRDDSTVSLVSPKGQAQRRDALAVSPSNTQEQTRCRRSPRTPEGTSRLEQKRQKYRQAKKSEPTN